MMNRSNSILLSAAIAAGILTGCKKDKNSAPPPVSGSHEKYVISATALTGLSGSSYVLTTDDVSGGSISTTGNGVETDISDGLFQNNTMFSFGYNPSGQSPVTPFKLGSDGKVVKGTPINNTTANIFGTVNSDVIVTAAVPRLITSPTATFSVLDAVNPKIKSTASVNLVNLVSGTGEMAYFTGLFQVGDKIFAPFMSIKGVDGDNFGTKYLDNNWIAEFSYPSMTLDKVIKDNRTGYTGEYFGRYGLSVTDNGNIYVFSTAVQGSTKHSGALLIKKGTTDFDQSYFFDLEAASGGSKIARMTYVSGSTFLAEFYVDPGKSTGKVKLAVIDVDKKTFAWVSNSPVYNQAYLTTAFYVEKDKNTVDLPVLGDTGVMNIYQVNITGKSATKGLEVKGIQMITAMSKITY